MWANFPYLNQDFSGSMKTLFLPIFQVYESNARLLSFKFWIIFPGLGMTYKGNLNFGNIAMGIGSHSPEHLSTNCISLSSYWDEADQWFCRRITD